MITKGPVPNLRQATLKGVHISLSRVCGRANRNGLIDTLLQNGLPQTP